MLCFARVWTCTFLPFELRKASYKQSVLKQFVKDPYAVTWYFVAGRLFSQDIAAFARKALTSRLQVLGPNSLEEKISSGEPWFVDFFSPVSHATFVIMI